MHGHLFRQLDEFLDVEVQMKLLQCKSQFRDPATDR
jgi:hypothetical protein